MKLKKGLVGVLALSLIASSVPAFAIDGGVAVEQSVKEIKPISSEIKPISSEILPIEYNIYYESVKGTILEISETEFGKVLYLGDGDNIHTHLSVPKDAYIVGEDLKVGDVVTGYFESGMMYTMIYPARRTAEVVVVESKENSVYVGVLNNELLTDNGYMYIQVGEKTEVTTADNKVYTGDLAYKKVVVLYGAVRESYPAQATADKIIVLGTQEKIKPIEQNSFYGVAAGKVVSIEDRNNMKYLSITDTEGIPYTLVIYDDTFILDNDEVQVGDFVSGYYDKSLPMIMIYPPQYTTEILVVENTDRDVHAGVFDTDMLSDDGTLVLKNLEETEIVTKDGKTYNGNIVDKKLVVLYTISTKSFPAHTVPTKIIVLDAEKEVKETSKLDIVVKGEIIEAPRAYNKGKTIMLPLRAICEELGYEIKWDNTTRTAFVGKSISLSIGKYSYNFGNTMPNVLGVAPEIVKGNTYVPVEFFTEVLKLNEVSINESINIK